MFVSNDFHNRCQAERRRFRDRRVIKVMRREAERGRGRGGRERERERERERADTNQNACIHDMRNVLTLTK
jgi:hypothetical protein